MSFGSARKEQIYISSVGNWIAYIPSRIAKIGYWPPGQAGSQTVQRLLEETHYKAMSKSMRDLLTLLQGFYETDINVYMYATTVKNLHV